MNTSVHSLICKPFSTIRFHFVRELGDKDGINKTLEKLYLVPEKLQLLTRSPSWIRFRGDLYVKNT